MVPAASELDGVNVATVSEALKDVVPATEFPPESVTENDTEVGTTASENVAVGAVETGLLVEPVAGVTLVTDGAAPAGCVVSKITSTA